MRRRVDFMVVVVIVGRRGFGPWYFVDDVVVDDAPLLATPRCIGLRGACGDVKVASSLSPCQRLLQRRRKDRSYEVSDKSPVSRILVQ